VVDLAHVLLLGLEELLLAGERLPQDGMLQESGPVGGTILPHSILIGYAKHYQKTELPFHIFASIIQKKPCLAAPVRAGPGLAAQRPAVQGRAMP